MANAIKNIVIMWVCIIGCYIILAFIYPIITSMTGESATMLQVSSNMSNYPGALAAVQGFPLWVWFLPGGIGFIATVIMIRSTKPGA